MPKGVIELSDHATRGVNAVKAKEGLRDKSAALERIVEEFEEHLLDPSLRPEFVESLQRVRKGRFRKVAQLSDTSRDSS